MKTLQILNYGKYVFIVVAAWTGDIRMLAAGILFYVASDDLWLFAEDNKPTPTEGEKGRDEIRNKT